VHTEPVSARHKAGILAAVYVAVLAINLDVTIVNVALPSIATQLHADTRALQWVVDGYNLSFAASSWRPAACRTATGVARRC
jgi:MFS family permease